MGDEHQRTLKQGLGLEARGHPGTLDAETYVVVRRRPAVIL
jgi:hypothetical protein